MIIRKFTAEDLPDAGKIAHQLWGNEVPDMPEKLRRRIYDYLPRYYFDPESEFNLAAEADGELKALLLASPSPPEPLAANEFLLQGLSAADRQYVWEYQAYLTGNRQLEENFQASAEIILLFFASIRPGCGKMLMQKFVEICRQSGFSSMLLWTDNTCNYQYYFDHQFELLHRQTAVPGLLNMELETLIFRQYLG